MCLAKGHTAPSEPFNYRHLFNVIECNSDCNLEWLIVLYCRNIREPGGGNQTGTVTNMCLTVCFMFTDKTHIWMIHKVPRTCLEFQSLVLSCLFSSLLFSSLLFSSLLFSSLLFSSLLFSSLLFSSLRCSHLITVCKTHKTQTVEYIGWLIAS